MPRAGTGLCTPAADREEEAPEAPLYPPVPPRDACIAWLIPALDPRISSMGLPPIRPRVCPVMLALLATPSARREAPCP